MDPVHSTLLDCHSESFKREGERERERNRIGVSGWDEEKFDLRRGGGCTSEGEKAN